MDLDYEQARRRAVLKRLINVVLRRPDSLVSLAEAKRGRALAGQVYGGLRQVCLDCIIGSVGRAREFDRNFNPLTNNTRERWTRVNRAFLNDVVLPPVEVSCNRIRMRVSPKVAAAGIGSVKVYGPAPCGDV